MKLIVGLGNPGKQYTKTRHNIGFMTLDALHNDFVQNNISDWSLNKKFNAEISSCTIKKEKVFLVKPMTFMNDSGQAVQLIAKYYKIPAQDIIVVHDDKDLLLGEIRVQENRGHAGHNGVKSIIQCLGTKEFARIRIGVDNEKKSKKQNTANFVLGKFGIMERKFVKQITDESVKQIKKILKIA